MFIGEPRAFYPNVLFLRMLISVAYVSVVHRPIIKQKRYVELLTPTKQPQGCRYEGPIPAYEGPGSRPTWQTTIRTGHSHTALSHRFVRPREVRDGVAGIVHTHSVAWKADIEIAGGARCV